MYVCSYCTHRDDVFPLWVHRCDSGSCTDLCTLPPASIGQNQTAIDLPVVAVTCVALPQAMQRDRGKHSGGGGGHSCWLSPERRAARWRPDWFSGPLPILYHQLSLPVSEVCSLRLSFGLAPAQSSSDEHLLLVCLRFDLWMEAIKSTVFWQQEQIMKEPEWSNLWPLPYH